jgi:hypothetical protein
MSAVAFEALQGHLFASAQRADVALTELHAALLAVRRDLPVGYHAALAETVSDMATQIGRYLLTAAVSPRTPTEGESLHVGQYL